MHTEKIGPLTAHLARGNDGRGGGTGPVVVLLHGFGAPGTDLVGLSEQLKTPAGTRFVFPEAPLVADIGQPGFEGRAWWPIDMLRLQMAIYTGAHESLAEHVPEGMAEAHDCLGEFLLALERRLELGSAPLVLGGFSQGAMLSTDFVLRNARKIEGLMILSGSLVAQSQWAPCYARHARQRFFQSHGTQDPILPFELAERLHTELSNAGWRGNLVRFQGGHGIGSEALLGANAFLADVLSER